MTHTFPHSEFGEGLGGSSLDTSCEECLNKMVADLDEKNFRLLAGLSRSQFELMLQAEYDHQDGTGLYNFWYGIMEMKAIKAFARRGDLMTRVRSEHV